MADQITIMADQDVILATQKLLADQKAVLGAHVPHARKGINP